MKADHADATKKIKIAKGQLDGILRMIDDDRYCIDISTQLMSTIALRKNVNKMILRAHVRSCVKEALSTDEDNPKVEEALAVLEKMADQA